VLQRLQDLTGETVALFVPMGTMRQCVDEIASPQPLSFKRGIGNLERVIYGATGRIILAHLLEPFFKTEPFDAKALMAELQNYTEGSSTPPQDYLDEILRIRRRGYAVSRNELIQGAVSVGAPIFDEHHQIAGSLGIFGPSVRLQAEQVKRCGALLVDAANEISRAMREAPSKS
jgi:DNA-binding IclR family transcriptional regulator